MHPKAAELHDNAVIAVTDAGEAHRWWLEIIYVLLLYGLYSLVRNVQGTILSVDVAMSNALDIIHLQEWLRLIDERTVQEFFLPHVWSIKFLNIYYGSAHFIVTIGVMMWLFHSQVERYIHWRNVIFATSAIALIGYMIYPLAPPRLMGPEFGFVDTLETVGGLWSFDSGAVQQISNQYAAMPSLHVAWSLWCAFAIMPVLRHAWSKVAIALYPALTVLAIVVTGNHFWLDVAGGALVFALGYALATWIERVRLRRRLSNSRPADLASSG